ncbi:Ger(x)C family spore germination protein [Ethanoligenens sp.]|uniref:Ger(x)C family spore germination protein n=1 Tax=Ethanoligenens sp. TaxID=2099655 RepID=UPI0039ECB333
MKLKRIAVIVCIVTAAFTMTGCWNYRELETLNLVAGFSIDKGTGGAGYHLTFEILDESGGGSNGGGDGGGSGSGIQTKLIESDGPTIFDAVRNTLLKTDKKLYFGDCKAVILSKQIADEGVAPLFDWISRDSEPRLTADLFVSEDATAENILKQCSPVNPVTSYALDKIVADNPAYISKAPYMQIYKADDALKKHGQSLILPALAVDKTQNGTPPKLAGTAVFKRDKLLGFLKSDESKYLLFIQNQVNGGLLLVNVESSSPDITLEIKRSETKVTVLSEGRSPKIGLSVKTEAALGEMKTTADFASESGITKLEQDADRILADSMHALITEVQNEYDSDIFGFGSAIYQNDPNYWNAISPHWDNLFKNLQVVISTDVVIKNTALTQSNVKARD